MGDTSEVIWTFVLDYTRGWGVRRHSHDYFQMYYCLSGEGLFSLNDQQILLTKNTCLIIRPHQPHELFPIKSGQLRIVDTKFYLHDENIRRMICAMPQSMEIADAQFRELQLSMRNEWASSNLFCRETANALFQQIIFLVLRKNAPAPNKIPFYKELEQRMESLTGAEREIANYLELHFLEPITLLRLSEDLRYSKTYLCKVFRGATGITIIEYINFLRIRKSYDMLCCTDKKISEISTDCGFSSVHYFSRTFHKIVGMSPSQARDQDRSSIYTDIRLHGTFQYRYFSEKL